ncbi:MAG: pyridoxal phosphate-dependent aminotransferase family protein [Rikenellaceae bacterium]|nr:pyridoxal phosphate-dependent aminotransferase family protein [Rikenellaceae bacterium]MBR2452219.1 pyridoxal phosphate-dependent aminotransferase family protein [Rikenellaceae bacterium]
MVDILDRLKKNAGGPLGQYMQYAHGYFAFPKLEGDIAPHMTFRGKPVLNWSLNNYLGLASHPEVRQADAEGAAQFGMAAPMGARMMSGQTKYHEQLERELAAFVGKEDAFLLNFGYQGMISIIDCLLTHRDVVVYDAEAHACIIDGLRMHKGKRFVFGHNDMESLRKQLGHATAVAEANGGGILVITEGVFGMKGDLGKLDEIVALKSEYSFRLLVDDAHGFGTMGPGGKGTAAHFGVVDGVDVLFNTFAKSMAGIGAFVASHKWLIDLFRYNMRSQIYAKSLPMPMVIGALKRLDLIRKHPEYQEKLWEITNALQGGFRERGFDIGGTLSPVTPVYMKGGVEEATNLVVDLRENYSLFCSVVVYPVIPKGEIILRIIPTAVHTLEDVNYTLDCFSKIREKLLAGEYQKPMPNMSDMKYEAEK